MAEARRGRPLLRHHRLRAVRRRRLRRRLLGPHRGRRRAGRAPPHADRPLDRPGVGGEPRLADLHPRRALDGVLRGLRVDHAHAVRAAHARGARHRAARARASPSARRSSARRDSGSSARSSRSSSVLVPFCMGAVAGAIASGRCPPGQGRRPVVRAGSTRRRSSAACSRSPSAPTVTSVARGVRSAQLRCSRCGGAIAARTNPRSAAGTP